MSKNIILLSDGTGNSASKLFKTNVWRLYQALDLRPPDLANPNRREQIAYYDDGVGTASFKPLAILGGAFGWGTKRIVLDLYTYLCRHYEPGDHIYAFGFSRGAFAIRMLTGLIASQGIVKVKKESNGKANEDPEPAGKGKSKTKKDHVINPTFLTERELRRLAAEAFRRYREECYPRKVTKAFRTIRNLFLGAMYKSTFRGAYKREKNIAAKGKGGEIEIRFLGLWDTVAAYGLPFDELTKAWDVVFPLSFPNRRLSPIVKRAYHALALDDERLTFHPEVWDEETELETGVKVNHRQAQQAEGDQKVMVPAQAKPARINQVWFAGMHSNVGGGYPDDALSGVPLNWVMDGAEAEGLVFLLDERRRLRESASAYGRQYDSRRGVGGLYRYMPRNVELLMRGNDGGDCMPKIHHSVIDRIRERTGGYAPIGLPEKYAVVQASGRTLKLNDPLHPEPTELAAGRCQRQQRVWNLVWWKRLVYFATVYIFIALASFPLFSRSERPPDSLLVFVSQAIAALSGLLPGFLSPWLRSFQGNPGLFLVIAGAFGITLFISSLLQNRIFDRMRSLWDTPAPVTSLPDAKSERGIAFWFRRRAGVFKFLKERVIPKALVLILGLLLLRGLFQFIDAVGWFARPAGDTTAIGDFDTKTMSWDSGKDLEEGKYYKITLMTKDDWLDNGEYKGLPDGVRKADMSWPMYAAVPLRRNIGQPYYKLIARIGRYGRDEYPLDLKAGEDGKTYTTEFTAPKSGKLFLYVNDAIMPWTDSGQIFYGNNKGTAAVTVEEWRDDGQWLPLEPRR